jgi:hypothetical protein
VLPLAERVLLDCRDEMAPVRLMLPGEFAWLISGVRVSLVSISAAGAVVEIEGDPCAP